MSLLSPTSDFLGNMSQSELNSQDIQNLQDEITRLQQNQDSINQTLAISAQGKQTVTVPSGGGNGSTQIPFPTLAATTHLIYAAPSDQGGKFYLLPYYEFNSSSALTKRFYAYSYSAGGLAGTTQPGINIIWQYDVACTITFYYFIIQQPTSVTL